MAKKRTAIEIVIESIQAEIDVRQKAIDMLRAQQAAAPKRKSKAAVTDRAMPKPPAADKPSVLT